MNLILTHKAIARMAGYRVVNGYAEYPNMKIPYGSYFGWQDMDDKDRLAMLIYESEAKAWKACCIANGLIEEVE